MEDKPKADAGRLPLLDWELEGREEQPAANLLKARGIPLDGGNDAPDPKQERGERFGDGALGFREGGDGSGDGHGAKR
jgi:hypothetical protein